MPNRTREKQRLTIADIQPGVIYSTNDVASIYGVSRPTVVMWINSNLLAAGRISGTGHYLVSGDEILRVWGALKLAEDQQREAGPISMALPKSGAELLRKIEAEERKAKQQPKKRARKSLAGGS